MKNLAISVNNARPVDYAIQVNGVSKTFRIPHEKISSLRGAFVNLPAKLCGAFGAGVFRSNGSEEFKALDGVSFKVHPVKSGAAGPARREFNGVKKGEFFGIIGRNGFNLTIIGYNV